MGQEEPKAEVKEHLIPSVNTQAGTCICQFAHHYSTKNRQRLGVWEQQELGCSPGDSKQGAEELHGPSQIRAQHPSTSTRQAEQGAGDSPLTAPHEAR